MEIRESGIIVQEESILILTNHLKVSPISSYSHPSTLIISSGQRTCRSLDLRNKLIEGNVHQRKIIASC